MSRCSNFLFKKAGVGVIVHWVLRRRARTTGLVRRRFVLEFAPLELVVRPKSGLVAGVLDVGMGWWLVSMHVFAGLAQTPSAMTPGDIF